MAYVWPIIVSYLLGSISFSFLAGKLLRGIDIRQHGSGNAGATNTLRVLGKGPGITVLVLDLLKGVAAVCLAWVAKEDSAWLPVFCGWAAIAGHNWPVYFGFRGGKGVATTIGVMVALAFLPALIAGLVTIAVIAITRYVSVGSLLFAVLIPILVLVMHHPIEIFWATLPIALFAFVRHRTNIVKLVQGKENKLGAKRL
ncbi:MAG: glycerol-3-phosphate 1-O-acyltransferase PlsY [Paenibacillaceae bacterium]|nr:glycerol-3-phosphate 1-O-acyltransferase PlsY [Paenibacillaceae bacterium]